MQPLPASKTKGTPPVCGRDERRRSPSVPSGPREPVVRSGLQALGHHLCPGPVIKRALYMIRTVVCFYHYILYSPFLICVFWHIYECDIASSRLLMICTSIFEIGAIKSQEHLAYEPVRWTYAVAAALSLRDRQLPCVKHCAAGRPEGLSCIPPRNLTIVLNETIERNINRVQIRNIERDLNQEHDFFSNLKIHPPIIFTESSFCHRLLT